MTYTPILKGDYRALVDEGDKPLIWLVNNLIALESRYNPKYSALIMEALKAVARGENHSIVRHRITRPGSSGFYTGRREYKDYYHQFNIGVGNSGYRTVRIVIRKDGTINEELAIEALNVWGFFTAGRDAEAIAAARNAEIYKERNFVELPATIIPVKGKEGLFVVKFEATSFTMQTSSVPADKVEAVAKSMRETHLAFKAILEGGE